MYLPIMIHVLTCNEKNKKIIVFPYSFKTQNSKKYNVLNTYKIFIRVLIIKF